MPTDRDQRIVRWVAEVSVTTRRQVQTMLFGPGGRSRCQERLSLLVRHRYLDCAAGPGANRPSLYFLSKRSVNGRRLLRSLGIECRASRPNLEGGRLQHTLRINDCRAHIVRGCVDGGVQLVEWRREDELAPVMVRSGLLPDSYFRVSRVTEGGERKASFFLEVERSGKSERVWRDKIRRYGSFYYGGEFERLFGTKALRVLVVLDSTFAASPAREAARLAALAAKEDVTLFRVGVAEDLLGKAPGAWLREPLWLQPGVDGQVRLLPVLGEGAADEKNRP
ncbi:MAG: replication-relaxation family protein [Chloroflexi bacterium]|nr:replication-relaxation family protein [Chloroflexota bacterium]